MATLAQIRQQYPQYANLSDQQLADGLHQKYYASMPIDQFYSKIGFSPAPAPAAPQAPPVAASPNAAPQQANPVAQTTSQGLSGINEGIANGLGAPVDLTTGLINLATSGINSLTGMLPRTRNLSDLVTGQTPPNPYAIPAITHPFLGSDTFKSLLAPTIAAPDNNGVDKFVRRVGQDVGAAALPSGLGAEVANSSGVLASQLGLSLLGGTGAATADAVTDSLPQNSTTSALKPYADMLGELAGLGTGVSAINLGRRLITPFDISPERQAAAATMGDAGVDLTAGQQTGNKSLQYLESELGGQGATENQAQQFTQAALAKAGVSAGRATPDVINQAFQNVGQQFNDLAARNPLQMDSQLSADLGAAVRDYNNVTPPSQRAPIIQNTLQDLVDAAKANGNQLSGDAYQKLTSSLGSAAKAAIYNPQTQPLGNTLFSIKGALDDAMERGIAANNPNDLGAWQDARNDYRNLLVLTKASTASGENAALGLISPASLQSAAKSVDGMRNYARGKSDFSDLARAGVATMSPLPNSGTAQRLGAKSLIGLPAALGAMAGSPGGIIGAGIGAGAATVAPWLLGKALLSNAGKSYLTNQLLSGAGIGLDSLIGPTGGMLANQAAPSPVSQALMQGAQ